jgi:putative Mg2+ transporter-C (MgtC) family protein
VRIKSEVQGIGELRRLQYEIEEHLNNKKSAVKSIIRNLIRCHRAECRPANMFARRLSKHIMFKTFPRRSCPTHVGILREMSTAFVVPCCTVVASASNCQFPKLSATVVMVVASALLCVQSPAHARIIVAPAQDSEEVSITSTMKKASSILALSPVQRQERDPPTSDLVFPDASYYAEDTQVGGRPEISFRSFNNPQVELEMLTRMAYAAMCGAIIGVERRVASATAGVRTLSLVSLGSAIFTLTAVFGLNAGSGAGRMGAAVSTGVGFLGAGAINRSGNGNRNLTTSASIWIAASLGVAAASGLYRLALKGAILTVFILRWGTLLRYMRLELRKNGRRLSILLRRIRCSLVDRFGKSESGAPGS